MSFYAPDLGRYEAATPHEHTSAHPPEKAARPIVTPYSFRTVPSRSLLHIRISGFWTPDIVADFAIGLRTAVMSMDCGMTRHLICCNVSDAAIQTQDVMAAFQQLISAGPTRARKMALFTTRMLSRMQSRRIVAFRENIAFFETEAAALAWLFDGSDL